MKNKNKVCCILNSIAAFLFTFAGIMNVITYGFKWNEVLFFAVGIVYISLAVLNYQEMKKEKEKN